MMAANSVRMRIRKYFFRKTTVFDLRLMLLRLSVVNVLLSILALSMQYLNRILKEYGEPQLQENVKESDLRGEDVPRSIRELKPDYTGTLDHENEIHHECPVCDSNIWNIKAIFDGYEISMYFIDMECSVCGTFAKAPTLVDKP